MTETDQKTFTITRIFDAPRAAIWHAWTDPDEAAAWWHPRGGRHPSGLGRARRPTRAARTGTR